jgi:putative hemolysin
MSTESAPSQDESRSSPLITRLLGSRLATVLRRFGTRPTTEEEIKFLLREGLEAGVFEEVEHEIVERVFRLSDLRASQLMTPMKAIVWLDVADPPEVMQQKIAESPHTRFPVCEGSIDNILGVVHIKDLLVQSFTGRPFSVKGLLKMPLLIYEGTPGLKVLEMFKKARMHVAVVLDEYGSVRGLLTVTDILEAIVGEMPVGESQE